ncbi:MAG: hypothetical protein J0L92_31575, partial [Deltaproteobacteria bacterium]|nr:hypothetical protein [Deltaproteobacteria bacterium]
PSTPATPAAQASDGERATPVSTPPPRPRTPEEQVRDRDHRLGVFVDLLVNFGGQGTDVAGFSPSLGVRGSPYTLRIGAIAIDLWLGATLGLHYVGQGLARGARLYLGLDLGGSVRIGDVNGFVLAGAWTPAVVLPFGHTSGGSLGAGRLRAGGQIGSTQVGLEWHGYQLDGDYVVHAFGLYFDWGFFS